MTSEEVRGWGCIVSALVLLCSLTILNRLLPIAFRAARLWAAWRARS